MDPAHYGSCNPESVAKFRELQEASRSIINTKGISEVFDSIKRDLHNYNASAAAVLTADFDRYVEKYPELLYLTGLAVWVHDPNMTDEDKLKVTIAKLKVTIALILRIVEESKSCQQ
jgi:hypothetical protein